MQRYLFSALAASLAAAGSVTAQTVTLDPLAEARLRYEGVEQDGLPRRSDAVTLRVRTGVEADYDRLSALIEGEGTLAIGTRYFDGLEGDTGRPTIADPQNIELNRASLSYAVPDRATFTAGRQYLALLDQRFVGAAKFRQNAQTFDAVRAQATLAPKLTVDISYVWNVRPINGIDGRGARPRSIGGNSVFALLGYASPIGTLTGFAYLIDADEAAYQGYRLSSQTYGARLAGKRALGGGYAVDYALSYARQSDYARNPNDYAADYWLAEAKLSRHAIVATFGYEVLGASDGRALTSVQTPYGAVFGFQGWADKFTTTPADGVRDVYAGLGARWPTLGRARNVELSAFAHHYNSDRLVRSYGDEVNLLASASVGGVTWSARYADYLADRFGTDTQKFWLTAEWAL
ncbi:hypothetical protein [Sphingomonas sp. Mn802worker]|uniref:hypothetical protein n=1 Tax=Sphingomonas sp. Mn802worker TaxID=629773 RepID=UPI000476661A|nr:hypothetical protein [Sphingomonas sp. Mn802worker]